MSKEAFLQALAESIAEEESSRRECNFPRYENEGEAIEAFARIAHLQRGDRVYFNRTQAAIFMAWGDNKGTAHLMFYNEKRKHIVGVETPAGNLTLQPFYDKLED